MINRHHVVRHVMVLLMMVTLAASVPSCHSGRRDPRSMTSTELVAAGERDTVFVRRVRMFEEIAAHIPTDSLARLYVGALDAPPAMGRTYSTAIACQIYRLGWQYGSIASGKAMRRVEDSLFTTPAARERWSDAQRRWPTSGPLFPPCDVSDLPRGADSLEIGPRKMIWP
jgi:hypothetical protein